MAKPRSVIVGGMKWKVIWNKKLPNDTKGLTDYRKQEILICSSLDGISKRHVFIHEILHAIWYSYTFRPRLNTQDIEEDIVSMIPPAIIQVLDDNPIVAKYICGVDNEDISR